MFSFTLTDQSRWFCERIKEALMRFCGKSEAEAIALIEGYWAGNADIEADALLYHEPPYYYAMCMAHHPRLGDNRPEWYRDPGLWPPPPGWNEE